MEATQGKADAVAYGTATKLVSRRTDVFDTDLPPELEAAARRERGEEVPAPAPVAPARDRTFDDIFGG